VGSPRGIAAKQPALELEGAFLVERALGAGLAIEELYCVPAREPWARRLLGGSLEPQVLSESAISEKLRYPFHRGVFALASRPRELDPTQALPADAGQGCILVLPEVNDPENLGSAFRNAAALGCPALLLGPSGPDPLCRRVLRVSMGASLSLSWARLGGPEGLALVASRGFVPTACVLDPGARDLRRWDRSGGVALVLGNEAFGLSRPWLEACRDRVTLPMGGGTDSLNVATAAAIFLYTLSYESPIRQPYGVQDAQ